MIEKLLAGVAVVFGLIVLAANVMDDSLHIRLDHQLTYLAGSAILLGVAVILSWRR